MLEQDVLEKYRYAGKIAAKVRDEMKNTIKEGMYLIDICEKAEHLIVSMGGQPAFPCNISINDVAAHYTSPPNDETTIPEGSLVKIDIGVHVDGYIADTSTTVCFAPELENMVQTSEEALDIAIKTIRKGIFTSDLGLEIQRAIERRGYKPISNLTGHQIGRYMIHTGKSLPNVSHVSFSKIQSGEIYAIEPFVTFRDAAGRVEEGSQSYIFRLIKRKPVKELEIKNFVEFIEKNFKTLPFAERWLKAHSDSYDYRLLFNSLLNLKFVMSYPIFVEASHKPVAQSEHTVYIDDNEAIVLT
ncbi:MAG: type II methionyl aminopeptidase [Candidatus Bathyarchaeia archaeon]